MPVSRGWSPPKTHADSSNWRYDMRKGWVPPGAPSAPERLQHVMPAGWDPAQRGNYGHEVVRTPKGEPAPRELVNYTPATGEIHDRGVQAPVQHEQVSLRPTGGPQLLGTGQRVGRGADVDEDGYDDETGEPTLPYPVSSAAQAQSIPPETTGPAPGAARQSPEDALRDAYNAAHGGGGGEAPKPLTENTLVYDPKTGERVYVDANGKEVGRLQPASMNADTRVDTATVATPIPPKLDVEPGDVPFEGSQTQLRPVTGGLHTAPYDPKNPTAARPQETPAGEFVTSINGKPVNVSFTPGQVRQQQAGGAPAAPGAQGPAGAPGKNDGWIYNRQTGGYDKYDPNTNQIIAHRGPGEGPPPGGAAAATQDIEGYIRKAAAARNIDPNTAVAVALSEGGLKDPVRQSDAMYQGVREQSYGPFQLNMQGGLGTAFQQVTGKRPDDPTAWQMGVDFALDDAAKNGWGAFHGAARVGIGNRQGLNGAAPVGIQAGPVAAGGQTSEAVGTRTSGTINGRKVDRVYLGPGKGYDLYEPGTSTLIDHQGPVGGPAPAAQPTGINSRFQPIKDDFGNEIGFDRQTGEATLISRANPVQIERTPDGGVYSINKQTGEVKMDVAPGAKTVGKSITQFNPETGKYEEVFRAPADLQLARSADGKTAIIFDPNTGGGRVIWMETEGIKAIPGQGLYVPRGEKIIKHTKDGPVVLGGRPAGPKAGDVVNTIPGVLAPFGVPGYGAANPAPQVTAQPSTVTPGTTTPIAAPGPGKPVDDATAPEPKPEPDAGPLEVTGALNNPTGFTPSRPVHPNMLINESWRMPGDPDAPPMPDGGFDMTQDDSPSFPWDRQGGANNDEQALWGQIQNQQDQQDQQDQQMQWDQPTQEEWDQPAQDDQNVAWDPDQQDTGEGQAVGRGGDAQPPAEGWTPPVPEQDIVGGGNKFGQDVSMEGTHMGTDLQAVKGTPALSPVEGVVTSVKMEEQGLGLQVVIRDSSGQEHRLSHLDKAMVQEGDIVTKGQQVATVGESGTGATGPHLDYRVEQNGQEVNPEPMMGQLAQLPESPDTIQEDGSVGTGEGEDIVYENLDDSGGNSDGGGDGGGSDGGGDSGSSGGGDGGFGGDNSSGSVFDSGGGSSLDDGATGDIYPGSSLSSGGSGSTSGSRKAASGSGSQQLASTKAQIEWEKEKFGQEFPWEKEKFGETLGWEKEKWAQDLQFQRDKLGVEVQRLNQDFALEYARHNLNISRAQTERAGVIENIRHDRAMEILQKAQMMFTAREGALNRQQQRILQGTFAERRQAELQDSALKNPWVQSLTGMAPEYGTSGGPGWTPGKTPNGYETVMGGYRPMAPAEQPWEPIPAEVDWNNLGSIGDVNDGGGVLTRWLSTQGGALEGAQFQPITTPAWQAASPFINQPTPQAPAPSGGGGGGGGSPVISNPTAVTGSPAAPVQQWQAIDGEGKILPGLDEDLYKSLYSTNAPLAGQNDVPNEIAKQIWDSWHDAGHPDNYDVTPWKVGGGQRIGRGQRRRQPAWAVPARRRA